MNDNKDYKHQQITSKKLVIEKNYVKPESDDDRGVKAVGFLLAIGIIVGIVFAYINFIYPNFIKKTYTVEDACANPYECFDNDDGSRSCAYYDSKDKLVVVRCEGTTTTSSSSSAVKTTSND